MLHDDVTIKQIKNMYLTLIHLNQCDFALTSFIASAKKVCLTKLLSHATSLQFACSHFRVILIFCFNLLLPIFNCVGNKNMITINTSHVLF